MRPQSQSWLTTHLRPMHVGLAWLGLVAAYTVLNGTTLWFSIPSIRAESLGHGILNTLPSYDAATAYVHIASYSPAAIRAYFTILALDVVLLVPLYTIAFAGTTHLATARVFPAQPRTTRLLVAVPLLAAALNVVEDALIFGLLQRWPTRHEGLAELAGSVTTAKTTLIVGSVLSGALLWLAIGASVAAFRLGMRRCHV